MRKENQDNREYLAVKLDALESLPGEPPLDMKASWSGIQSRLRPAKKRMAAWWWAAAGIFILCAGQAGFRLLIPRGQPPVREGRSGQTKPTAVKKRSSPPSGVAATPTIDFIPPATVHRAAVARRTAVTMKKKNPPPRQGEPGSPQVAASRPTPVRQPVSVIPENNPARDSGISVTAVVRQPLRVIHLNELDEPALPDAAVNTSGRNERPHPIRFFSWRRPEPNSASSPKSVPNAVYSPLLRINLNGSE